MSPIRARLAAPVAVATALFSAGAEVAAMDAEHLRLELVSELPGLVPGQPAWLGLRLRHEPHWHTYWINPGDSGLPTGLKWVLPAGYSADAIAWPAPSRFVVGGLHNFGYTGDRLLPLLIHVPADANAGERVVLSAQADWLVCREECIPGKADLALELPVATGSLTATATSREMFDRARAAVPRPAPWTGSARMIGKRIVIRLHGAGLPPLAGLDIFAAERRILDNAPPSIHRDGDTLVIEAGRSDSFDAAPATLDLVLSSTMTKGATAAWRIRVPFTGESGPQ